MTTNNEQKITDWLTTTNDKQKNNQLTNNCEWWTKNNQLVSDHKMCKRNQTQHMASTNCVQISTEIVSMSAFAASISSWMCFAQDFLSSSLAAANIKVRSFVTNWKLNWRSLVSVVTLVL